MSYKYDEHVMQITLKQAENISEFKGELYLTYPDGTEALNDGTEDLKTHENDGGGFGVGPTDCFKCGKPFIVSDNEEYTYQCMDCDEDFC